MLIEVKLTASLRYQTITNINHNPLNLYQHLRERTHEKDVFSNFTQFKDINSEQLRRKDGVKGLKHSLAFPDMCSFVPEKQQWFSRVPSVCWTGL